MAGGERPHLLAVLFHRTGDVGDNAAGSTSGSTARSSTSALCRPLASGCGARCRFRCRRVDHDEVGGAAWMSASGFALGVRTSALWARQAFVVSGKLALVVAMQLSLAHHGCERQRLAAGAGAEILDHLLAGFCRGEARRKLRSLILRFSMCPAPNPPPPGGRDRATAESSMRRPFADHGISVPHEDEQARAAPCRDWILACRRANPAAPGSPCPPPARSSPNTFASNGVEPIRIVPDDRSRRVLEGTRGQRGLLGLGQRRRCKRAAVEQRAHGGRVHVALQADGRGARAVSASIRKRSRHIG